MALRFRKIERVPAYPYFEQHLQKHLLEYSSSDLAGTGGSVMVSGLDVALFTPTTSRSDFLAWGPQKSLIFFCTALLYSIFALITLIRGYLWIALVVQWGTGRCAPCPSGLHSPAGR